MSHSTGVVNSRHGLGAVGGLAQRPHQFYGHGLGGHVLGFQHAGQLFHRAAHLIHRQVAPLVGDLGGKHSQAAAGAPILQAGVHFAVLAAGRPPTPKLSTTSAR